MQLSAYVWDTETLYHKCDNIKRILTQTRQIVEQSEKGMNLFYSPNLGNYLPTTTTMLNTPLKKSKNAFAFYLCL